MKIFLNDINIALELDNVLGHVSERSFSETASRKIVGLKPFSDIELLKDAIFCVTEMRGLIEYDDAFPIQNYTDVRPLLKKAEAAGAFLAAEAFLELLNLITMMRRIANYLVERTDKYPKLNQKISRCVSLEVLEKEIGKVIDAYGQIKDSASPELSRLRRERMKMESKIRSRLDAILGHMSSKGYTQEDALVMREGRLVIPLKESCRNRISGIAIDQSASGSTVFVEPLEVMEMHQLVSRLVQKEQQEIRRILTLLTDHVRGRSKEIAVNFEAAVILDIIRAKAVYSIEINGSAAEFSKRELILKEARHPLLLMKEGMQVVPLTVSLGEGYDTLIITGPNAGGKTVALKTMGLLSLMHACGFHVPARADSRIPLFSNIFADIGDRQSIEQDLSTFSSHVSNLTQIVKKSDQNSLVLIDEIGSATDPAEGAALAQSILSHLTAKGCLTAATTHISSLKIFAHETLKIENGSMVFDQESLQPTYRFQPGIPGSSYAFEIAGRYGLPETILQQAKTLIGDERGAVDRLITHLQDETGRIEKARHEVELKETRLDGLMLLYKDRLEQLRNEGDVRVQNMILQAEETLDQANIAAENLIREIRESQADKESVQKAKLLIKEQRGRVKKLKITPVKMEPEILEKGDFVRWSGQGGKGEVIAAPDKKGKVLVRWGDIKLNIPASELKRIESGGSVKKKDFSVSVSAIEKEIRDEIDLRGMSAIEAKDAAEIYLGDARMKGYSVVRIIHGKGTGVLRTEIGKMLKKNALVKSMRQGNWNEGDTGVTIVELA